MSQERLMAAIARIDAALDRIEAGARPAAADPALAARHARLRTATADAIGRLDRLIGADVAG